MPWSRTSCSEQRASARNPEKVRQSGRKVGEQGGRRTRSVAHISLDARNAPRSASRSSRASRSQYASSGAPAQACASTLPMMPAGRSARRSRTTRRKRNQELQTERRRPRTRVAAVSKERVGQSVVRARVSKLSAQHGARPQTHRPSGTLAAPAALLCVSATQATRPSPPAPRRGTSARSPRPASAASSRVGSSSPPRCPSRGTQCGA